MFSCHDDHQLSNDNRLFYLHMRFSIRIARILPYQFSCCVMRLEALSVLRLLCGSDLQLDPPLSHRLQKPRRSFPTEPHGPQQNAKNRIRRHTEQKIQQSPLQDLQKEQEGLVIEKRDAVPYIV